MTTIRERLIAGEIPREALTAIAAMTFPLPVEELLDVFPLVHEKGDDGVKTAVLQSFDSLTPTSVSEFLRHSNNSATLAFYYEMCGVGLVENADTYVLDIVRNPACTFELLEQAASLTAAVVLEFLINNHQLLQKYPSLLDALKENEALSAAQKRRLVEYTDFGMIRGPEYEVPEPDAHRLAEEQGVDEGEADAEEPGEALILASEFLASEDPEALNSTSAIEMEDDMDLSTYQRLLSMKVSDKIQCALKGDKEERTILIRDSNRTVALAVVESPKLTEQEVEVIASLRNVHRDVLRSVGKNRKFLKKYKVVSNLVKNPKVPQDVSMSLLHRLTDRDLQLMTRDRSLSEFLRKAAQRILKTRKKH